MPFFADRARCVRTAKAWSWLSNVPVSSTMKHRSPGESMKTPIFAFTADVITPISWRCA